MKIILSFASAVSLVLVSCGGKNNSDRSYRYEHVATLAGDYVKMLTSATLSQSEMQYLLFDIRSRADLLTDRGEAAMSRYFIAEIEDGLRDVDPELADSLTGLSRPRSVFMKKIIK